MTKIKTIIFALCLGMVASQCYANRTNNEKNDGVPITITKTVGHGTDDRSSSISASIDGHNLTVNFLSDIGHVWIKITDEAGVTLEIEYIETPTGYLYYMPSAGHYVLVITLSDSDEYEGEFDVTE